MNKLPLEYYAIKVEQPLGSFYAVSIPAKTLLKVCYSSNMDFQKDKKGEVKSKETLLGNLLELVGTQRENQIKRLNEIKSFIKQVDSHFPNSIILGANYTEKGEYIYDSENSWQVKHIEDDLYKIKIPTYERLASIIDGQHRLFAFKDLDVEMNLLCSIYIDLPMPYHAQIFTDINMNQTKVNKNFAYNFFQYDMMQGEIKSWAPETLAVYYTRMLASQEGSPLKGKIKIGVGEKDDNSISLGCIVDSILSLITTNAKKDRMKLHQSHLKDRDRSILSEFTTSAPLRALYINNKNKTLYEIIMAYLEVVVEEFWNKKEYAIFTKSLGMYTLFDILKEILKNSKGEEFNKEFFKNKVNVFSSINFNDPFFDVQTKVRKRIKDIAFYLLGYISKDALLQRGSEEEQRKYKELLKLD